MLKIYTTTMTHKMQVGTLEIITFRTQRTNHPFLYALKGMMFGLSTGHISLRFVIDLKHKDLFEKFIHKHQQIVHKTHPYGYEIYCSYWPRDWQRDWTSRLVNHRYDCEQSANLSPFQYKKAYEQYLNPVKKIITISTPFTGEYRWGTVTLPPAIILHTSRLQNQHGLKIAQFAQIYAKVYCLWRKSIVSMRNAEKVCPTNTNLINKIKHSILIAESCMHTLENILNKDITDLDEYITYGNPERDVVKLPLYLNHLIVMLRFIIDIADNPTKYKYNLLKSNCAHISLLILAHAYSNELRFASILHKIGLPITPTYMMQTLAGTKLTEHNSDLSAATSNPSSQP